MAPGWRGEQERDGGAGGTVTEATGRLAGKVALVTGAGSGVGRATVQLFVREGASVIAAGRTLAKVEETAALAGPACVAVRCDVSDEDDVSASVGAATQRFGALHVVVNNAAIGYSAEPAVSMKDILVTSPQDWATVLDINLTSVFLVSRHAVPQIIASGGGSIVNVSSINALRGSTRGHAYAAAKAGMNNLTRSMALTYGPRGVRVNVVAPGGIDTPMLAPRVAEVGRESFSSLPGLGRLAGPEEIAYPILWLASDEASYVNGSTLVVDGGTTA